MLDAGEFHHTADEFGKHQGMRRLVHEDILKRTVE